MKILKKTFRISLVVLLLTAFTPLFTSSLVSSNNAYATSGVEATKKANNNAFVRTLCNVLAIATGNGGKAFAAFAIISLGIGFFTGKVSWGLMLGVAAGIAAMFGAPTIVSAIAGGGSFNCEENTFKDSALYLDANFNIV